MRGQRGQWWSGHWPTVLYDVAPPAFLLTLGLVDVYTGALTTPIGTAPPTTSIIPGTLACAALVIRRRLPLVTLTIVLVVIAVPPLILPTSLNYWNELVVWLVALYSCARHLRRSVALAGLALSGLGLLLLALEFAEIRDPGELVYNSVLLVVAFAIGLLARSWSEYRDRVGRASAERAVAEERASRAERDRIARELHDVLAHTITVIVLQAGGARLASVSEPAIAIAALERIEQLGRASLSELRTLLPLLQEGEGDAATSPQPTLAGVAGLCERMRGLGFPVTLDEAGDTEDLPLGVQLTGYRIVQEGLTNVVKHSGRAGATVSICRAEETMLLTIEVASRLQAVRPSVPGAGRGLNGLRARVELSGGTMTAGAQSDGRFLLHAELPTIRQLT
ncbi:MAG: histidine kinase [Microbacteriaceae bacterium]